MQREPQRPPNTRDLAVMLYVSNKEIGDNFYNTYLQQLNFPRTRYPNATFYTDYHITIAYLKNVHFDHIDSLSGHITSDLTHKIDINKVLFKFGMPTLLGLPRRPFIAILPENTDDFCNYNKIVFNTLQSYKNGLYHLDTHTLPDQYLPHINLYAQANKTMPSRHIESTFKQLWESLRGKSLPLTKIRIR